MNHYSTIEFEARTREIMKAFWAGSSYGRPALFIKSKNGDDKSQIFEDPPLLSKELDLSPEYHARLGRRWTNSSKLFAEAMPGHQLTWGSCLTTLPVIAGGDYEYHDSAWIKPIPDILSRPLPVFNPQLPIVKKLEACYRAAMNEVKGEAFFSGPVMIDGLTTLSLFLTTEELCILIHENPEPVRDWSKALSMMFSDIYDHFYQFLKNECGGNGDSVCFFGPLYEGKSESVQCDFAVMLSPKSFEKMVMPDLELTTSRLDTSLYHLDGTEQLRFLDQLSSLPKLTGIQWNPEIEAAKRPLEWIETFKRIRAKDLVLFLAVQTPEEVIEITRAVGPDGLFFRLPTYDTPAEAREAISIIERAFPLTI